MRLEFQSTPASKEREEEKQTALLPVAYDERSNANNNETILMLMEGDAPVSIGCDRSSLTRYD